jgi:glycosyltransferase involved in cell wall biosynthesis
MSREDKDNLQKKDKQKVFLIAPQPFFENRGTPMNVKALASSLSEQGYAVDLLVYPIGNDVQMGNVRVLRSMGLPFIKSVPIGPSWTKVLLDIPLSFYALYLGLSKPYQVVHGIEEGGFLAGVIGKLRKIPYVFDMDSCMCEQLNSRSFFGPCNWVVSLFERMESAFIRNASAVLTVCEALTDKARAISSNVPIFQIEDFPLPDNPSDYQSVLENLRKEYDVSSYRNIVYTGNLAAYQGIDLLVESFAHLKQKIESQEDRPARLLIVGGGNVRGEKIQHYKAKARELGLEVEGKSSDVVFFGNKPSKEMGAYMRLADALVSPRLEGENTPLKLYSYMSTAIPVVATNIRSHTQVLTEDEAFLADVNTESYAKALDLALSQDQSLSQAAQEKGKRAQDLVDRKYSYREFNRKLSSLYESLI